MYNGAVCRPNEAEVRSREPDHLVIAMIYLVA